MKCCWQKVNFESWMKQNTRCPRIFFRNKLSNVKKIQTLFAHQTGASSKELSLPSSEDIGWSIWHCRNLRPWLPSAHEGLHTRSIWPCPQPGQGIESNVAGGWSRNPLWNLPGEFGPKQKKSTLTSWRESRNCPMLSYCLSMMLERVFWTGWRRRKVNARRRFWTLKSDLLDCEKADRNEVHPFSLPNKTWLCYPFDQMVGTKRHCLNKLWFELYYESRESC